MRFLAWLPNGLTVLRLLLALALPWSPREWQFWLLLVAGFSDLIDGWLSRCLGVSSGFGQFVDPVADKTLVLAAVTTAYFHGWLAWTELLGLAARDLAVLTLSACALALGWNNWRKLTPRWSGKIATGAQVTALLALFWRQQPLSLLVWTAAAISIGSAIDYLCHAVRAARAKPALP
jgi:CDP-diacylglycerol--glycerol-3-phosphate 3-phosphatidyltransferase